MDNPIRGLGGQLVAYRSEFGRGSARDGLRTTRGAFRSAGAHSDAVLVVEVNVGHPGAIVVLEDGQRSVLGRADP